MKGRLTVFLLLLIGLSACKKDNMDETEPPVSPLTGTRTEFTLDSIYLYARQVYLWSDALPSYQAFNPRKYAAALTGITAFRTELYDISQLKNNPVTGKPYEFPLIAGNPKYSHLESGTGSGIIAATGSESQQAVLKTALLNAGPIPVAYIALGAFPPLNTCKAELDNAFSLLAASGPRHLIIDLRTNGGGYVETAEYVANLVAPASLNGQVIYTEQYNALLQSGKATILKYQPYLDNEGKQVIYNSRMATMADIDFTEKTNTYRFSKKGPMQNITDIYFIVSSHTASASELLISCLKPYFNVKLTGERTYGKPVGFFAINIDTYSVYLSSFLIRNSLGWSDYFTGIPADISISPGTNPILGDPEEPCIQATLTTIKTGAGISSTQKSNDALLYSRPAVSSLNNGNRNAPAPAQNLQFPGMIENRHKLKKLFLR